MTQPTTTTTTTTKTEPVALDGEALPCTDCGQAVEHPRADPSRVVKVERVRRGLATLVEMTTCAACTERDQAATDLAHRHLPLGVTFDGRRYGGKDAARLLVDARTALDAAGTEPASVETSGNPAAALTAEIVHLSRAVRGLRWRDRLNAPESLVAEPVRLVEPGTANPHRWAHLGSDDHAGLLVCTGRVLAERVASMAPPVVLTPPDLPEEDRRRGTLVRTGCLYCGIGSITMSALSVSRHGGVEAAVELVWTRRLVTPRTIGARRGAPTQLVGWLCPPCEKAAAHAGSASTGDAVEAALSTYLGVSRRTLAGEELQVVGRLRGWGALAAEAQGRGRPEPEPNATPWSHLSRAERDALANDWRRGGS